jgi:hypothetical protein
MKHNQLDENNFFLHNKNIECGGGFLREKLKKLKRGKPLGDKSIFRIKLLTIKDLDELAYRN